MKRQGEKRVVEVRSECGECGQRGERGVGFKVCEFGAQ